MPDCRSCELDHATDCHTFVGAKTVRDLWVKAATVLLLICAQTVSRISTIRLDALTTDASGDLRIRFADAEVEMPRPLADPVTALIEHRPNMNTARIEHPP